MLSTIPKEGKYYPNIAKMITFVGNKWIISEQLNNDEMVGLYYALNMALDHTQETELRRIIVDVAEKMFGLSEEVDLTEILKNDT